MISRIKAFFRYTSSKKIALKNGLVDLVALSLGYHFFHLTGLLVAIGIVVVHMMVWVTAAIAIKGVFEDKGKF